MSRLVSPAELREHLGVSRSAFARLRAAGTIPPPLPGSRRYDLQAVNLALDKLNKPASDQRFDEDELIARARQWRKSA